MTKVKGEISTSLDGFVAGPNQTLEQPLGEGGELLHEWALGLASFRERHGMEGGERSPDDDLFAEGLRRTGAVVMGRRMFSGGNGPWADDPNADGWWGDEPPFRVPVFVVTHHARETVASGGGTSFTFVTGGVEAAVEQARAAAREKDVVVAGGADVIQQGLGAGLIDTLLIHVAPVLLAGGVRLFDRPGGGVMTLEAPKVTASPNVTHLEFAVPKGN